MIRFWIDMLHRNELKRTDKILVGNIDTEEPNYVDLSEILSALSTDDLPEGESRKYLTPELKTKLENLSESNYTLTQLANYFYPKSTNPAGYLTALSDIAAARITGILAAGQIPDLAAGKITTGLFNAARIPDLPASKITSGTFHVDRIPTLPASKIESFSTELSKYILKTSIGKANGLAQMDENLKLLIANIPDLPASQITSGTIAEQRLPSNLLKSTQLIDHLNSEDPNAPASANAVRLVKEYVNRLIQNIKLKSNALCATTGNVALTAEQVIDGVQTAESRVVVRAQTNPVENGLYLTAAGAWTRTTDTDTAEELVSATVHVEEGATYAGKKFYANDEIELGVTDVVWTQIVEDYVTPESLAIAKQEAINHSDANRADLELQIDAVEEDVLNHENRIFALEAVSAPVSRNANFIIAAADYKKDNYCTAALIVTVPANATTPIPVGFESHYWQIGTGSVTFVGATGVTINFDASELAEIAAQYNAVTLKKIATDVWILIGALKKTEV